MLGIRHAIYNGTIICHNPVNRMKKSRINTWLGQDTALLIKCVLSTL